LIHLFSPIIAAAGWFERNYSWYTGFTVMGYPLGPSDDRITVLSGRFKIQVPLPSRGNIIHNWRAIAFAATNDRQQKFAGYGYSYVFSSLCRNITYFSIANIIAMSILMHSFPEIYLWLETGRLKVLFTSLSLLAVTVSPTM
jgi:hypothetical protein